MTGLPTIADKNREHLASLAGERRDWESNGLTPVQLALLERKRQAKAARSRAPYVVPANADDVQQARARVAAEVKLTSLTFTRRDESVVKLLAMSDPLAATGRRPEYTADAKERALDLAVNNMGGIPATVPRTNDERRRLWASGVEMPTHQRGRLETIRCARCGGRFAPDGDRQHTAPHRKGQPGHR
jgi:hypothetical protein